MVCLRESMCHQRKLARDKRQGRGGRAARDITGAEWESGQDSAYSPGALAGSVDQRDVERERARGRSRKESLALQAAGGGAGAEGAGGAEGVVEGVVTFRPFGGAAGGGSPTLPPPPPSPSPPAAPAEEDGQGVGDGTQAASRRSLLTPVQAPPLPVSSPSSSAGPSARLSLAPTQGDHAAAPTPPHAPPADDAAEADATPAYADGHSSAAPAPSDPAPASSTAATAAAPMAAAAAPAEEEEDESREAWELKPEMGAGDGTNATNTTNTTSSTSTASTSSAIAGGTAQILAAVKEAQRVADAEREDLSIASQDKGRMDRMFYRHCIMFQKALRPLSQLPVEQVGLCVHSIPLCVRPLLTIVHPS